MQKLTRWHLQTVINMLNREIENYRKLYNETGYGIALLNAENLEKIRDDYQQIINTKPKRIEYIR